MFYHFKIHKEKSGYWAECLELEGCLTQANSIASLKANAEEALQLYLAEPANSDLIFPLPKAKKLINRKNIFAVQVEPGLTFSMMLRHLRVKNGYTQKETALLLGMKSLFTYQTLESKNANPELKTLFRLKRVFPELDVEAIVA